MPSRIRVLHLITGLNTGGAEMVLFRLLQELAKREFEFHVVTLVPIGSVGEKIQELGIPVDSLEMPPGRPTLSGFLKLIRIIQGFHPNILQTWLVHADLLGLAAGKLTGVPAIAWNIRGSEQNIMNSPGLSRIILRICALLSGIPQAILVNSKAGQLSHEKLGYHPQNWQYIPNGIDTTTFAPDPLTRKNIRSNWGYPDDLVIIGLVARLDPQKGHQFFFRAAKILISNYSNLRFVCIGDGPEQYLLELQEQVKTLGLEQYVVLEGPCVDMPAVYNSLDLLVSSSAYGEGFPNVIAEAMACGIPCIATRTGDSADLLADAGLIVPPRDPQALSGAISQILSLPAEERKLMGERARQRIIDHFSLGKMTAAYADLYHQLVRNQPSLPVEEYK